MGTAVIPIGVVAGKILLLGLANRLIAQVPEGVLLVTPLRGTLLPDGYIPRAPIEVVKGEPAVTEAVKKPDSPLRRGVTDPPRSPHVVLPSNRPSLGLGDSGLQVAINGPYGLTARHA
jgi:hypothetical protein